MVDPTTWLDLLTAVTPEPPQVPESVSEPLWQIVWEALRDAASFALTLAGLYLLGRKRWNKAHAKRRKERRQEIRDIVDDVVEPLRDTTSKTHDQLTVNGGRSPIPTVLDRLERLDGKVDHLGHAVHSNTRRLEEQGDKLDQAQEKQVAHEEAGRTFLASALEQLRQQGITITVPNDDTKD